MNQIVNMIIRQVMNQLIHRGVRAGFDQVGKAGDRRKKQQHVTDELGNTVSPEMTPEERRANRAARQHAREAKQRMKTMRRVSKF